MESITDRQAGFDPDLIDLQIIIDVPIISNSIEERTTNHEHEKGANTFTLCIDPNQKKRCYQLVFNIKKRL